MASAISKEDEKNKNNNGKVAAIVVTYNRKDLLLENIEHLRAQSASDQMDIVIIDNKSTDGTRKALDKYIEREQIIYVNTGANLGGAGGFQYGIRYAAEHGYSYVWAMDDDCMPERDTLVEFFKADQKLKGKYGFLSSKVLWKDRSICTMNVQRATLTKNVTDFSSDLVPVVMASFVSLFIPVAIVDKMGLPIKEFFIWTDDWEYTRRISKKYACYLVNNSVVIHKSKSNIGANIANDSLDRLDRYNYLYRNDVYLYRREGLNGFMYESVRLSWHILRVILRAKNNKLKRVGIIIKGTKEGFNFNPEIEFADQSNFSNIQK